MDIVFILIVVIYYSFIKENKSVHAVTQDEEIIRETRLNEAFYEDEHAFEVIRNELGFY